jgi:hypothetical protein
MSDYKAREVGQEAERVLASDAFNEAWAAYKARIIELWQQAKDVDVREDLHKRISIIDGVRAHIERLVKEGKIAAVNIETDEKRGFLRRVIG